MTVRSIVAITASLFILACGSDGDSSGGGTDTAGGNDVQGTDTAGAGTLCTFTGAKACLNDLEAAAACWQPSGTCTANGGDYSFANGATATTSGGTVTYAMNGTTCFSGNVAGSAITWITPDNRMWTGTAASDGTSVDITCPDNTQVTVATNEKPNCVTASSSNATAAIATCF